MFNRVHPSLKTRVLIDERRYDMSRSDKNSERYVIPMHRKNVWTNAWMQDPRKNLLQVSYRDPSVQYSTQFVKLCTKEKKFDLKKRGKI